MRIVIQTPIGENSLTTFDVDQNCQIWKLKEMVCKYKHLPQKEFCLILQGDIIDEDRLLGDLDIHDSEVLALIPMQINAAIEDDELIREYRYIRTQFPLVKMVDLMTYTGRLRCERGHVKDLADKGIWPFTEYVKWHEFKMVLSYLHPYKPPTVTWLTDINHPNIVPHKKGKVCVSILGKKWLPNTKLAAVINALHFLLADPNPYSAYPTKKCKEVAKICRMYGFPLKRKKSPS